MIGMEWYNKVVAIVPGDTVASNFNRDQNNGFADAIYVGAAGTVTMVFEDNTTFQATAVAGQIIPFRCKRVNATGTAGSLLGACYRI